MIKISSYGLALIFLLFALFMMSAQYLKTRPIKLIWSTQEAYLMRFQWLESVNLYLKTGKILMLQEDNRLEDLSTGEDQGYPFLLSLTGKSLGMQEMNFGTFIRFNYLLMVALGLAASFILFLTFNSLLISILFYFFYLRLGIYDGGIDHHWMIGAYMTFYISFLILFLKKRTTFKHIWFLPYFLIAGIANIVREGDGLIGILILISLLIIVFIQDGKKKYKQSFSLNKLKSIFRLKFLSRHKNILIISLFILVYLAPTLLLNEVRSRRNLKYFNGESSDMITHHGIWHNAFMGLGYIPNSYGIQWDDNNPIKFVHRVNPNVGYMTNEYYDILQNIYFQYSFESPSLWFGNVLAKAKAINILIGEFTNNSPGKILPAMLKDYFLYISLIAIFILTRKDKVTSATLWLIVASLLISSLPGLIGTPMSLFLGGLRSAFFMTWFYLACLIYLNFKDYAVKRKFNVFNKVQEL